MTGGDWVALAAFVLAGTLAVAVIRMRVRLRHLEGTTTELDELVRRRLEPRLAEAVADARAAGVAARDAAIASGSGVPSPRLPLESVTGPMVRAVAFGASARRAFARVTTPARSSRRDHRRSA
jgi:hypothetical protein